MRAAGVMFALLAACSTVKPRPPTKVDDTPTAGSGKVELGSTSRLGAVPAPDAPPADAPIDAWAPSPLAAKVVAELEATVVKGRAAFVAAVPKAAVAQWAAVQKIVGTGGCAAVAVKKPAPDGEAIAMTCTGGSGRIAIGYKPSAAARGYDLAAFYDDSE